MERGKSNLIIGLGVGSVVGALVYHFWCSPKGKMEASIGLIHF